MPLSIAVVTFLAYAPGLRNGLVWDDTALILRDPLIRSWRLIPEGFQHFLFTDATASDFYRPIQRLTYTLEYAAYGVRPFGYHATSIAIHAAAAVALFFLIGELLRLFDADERQRRYAPAIAALIWAVHPIHSGAVAYISGRADPLAAVFGFTGLTMALRAGRATAARKPLFHIAAGALLLLSSLSKEAGLIFLLLWPAIVVVQRNWRALRAVAVVVFVVLATYLSLRLPAEHIPPAHIRPSPPLLVRPLLVARAFAEYTYLIFCPLNLHMERDVETYPSGFGNQSLAESAWRELETLAGLVSIAAFIYWLGRERKRDRPVFTFLLVALLSYLPVSGIVTLNANVAEHWLYLPSAFLFAALSLALLRFAASAPARSRVMRGAVAAIIVTWSVFLAGRSFTRTFDWKDQRTFFERCIANGGDSARMLINLAGVEMNENRLDDAKAHLAAALQKAPDQPLAVLNMGAVAIRQGDFKTAREFLTRATQLPIVDAQAHELLAVLGNKESGTTDLLRMRLAARTGPPNWSIEKRYVRVLHESGATEAAIAELRHWLESESYRAESWQLLGELLVTAGRNDDAREAFSRANRYDVRLAARPPVL